MSLLEFPPLNNTESFSYCIRESNGRLIYGSKEEIDLSLNSELLRKYPPLNKDRLHCLEHALSRDNVRRIFNNVQNNKLTQAYDIWQKDGAKGVWDYVAQISEESRFGWPIAKIGYAVRQAEEGFKKVFVGSEKNVQEVIAENSDVLNWDSNWIRYLAISPDGERIAVCQTNDYVRVFMCDGVHRSPLTLKHSLQKNVANLAWKPFDQFVLAVACSTVILVWRFSQQKLVNRVPVQCAQVLELPSTFCPATQCIWDTSLSATLFVSSPCSSQILIIDTASGENQSIGSWLGSRVKRLLLSPDGSKILVFYHSNIIRVYDLDTWEDECWGRLKGHCVAAVWSPDSSFFLFSCEDEPLIRAVRFVNRVEITADGERLQRQCGTHETFPIYEVTEVERERSDSSESRPFGGTVHDMQLSPDGQRLAISFKKDCSIIALFIVDDKPKIRLTPCGHIEGNCLGDVTIMRFFPRFSYGSLLAIAWSIGKLQYLPLLYGATGEVNSKAVRLFASSTESKSGSDGVDNLLDELSSPNTAQDLPSSNFINRSITSQKDTPDLFTTVGLYDQLISKSTAGEEKS